MCLTPASVIIAWYDIRSWIAQSFFNKTDARHGFPCYDEPAMKAKYKIKITHGKSYHAASNMPETRIEKLVFRDACHMSFNNYSI